MPNIDTDYLQKRTTSAGYRFPVASHLKTSEYHEKCVPVQDRQRAQAAAQDKGNNGKPIVESSNIDAVTADKIWKQAVKNEKMGLKHWEENWGFMTEFDSKGRSRTPQELPDKINMFSQGTVPNTNGGNYGSQVNTELGQKMQNMEFQFNSNNRKRKLGSEMVCY